MSREANREAMATLEEGMESGEHSFSRRLRDFCSPVGNRSRVSCLLTGHKWYVDSPKKFQFHSPTRYEYEHGVEFPDNPLWTCFCQRCGAGSKFEELPDDVFETEYWCYSTKTLVDGEDIIDHAKEYLDENVRWPVIGLAETHFRGSR